MKKRIYLTHFFTLLEYVARVYSNERVLTVRLFLIIVLVAVP